MIFIRMAGQYLSARDINEAEALIDKHGLSERVLDAVKKAVSTGKYIRLKGTAMVVFVAENCVPCPICGAPRTRGFEYCWQCESKVREVCR